MNYRRLGRTGLKISAIGLGTMQFGWTADETASFSIMDRAWDLGITFFDTADIYSRWAENSAPGRSEEIIGRWLERGRINRHDLILATKVRGQMGDRPTDQGLSRHHIMRSVENSLQRLQTDYIDLYQVHFPDEETPLEETLSALSDLVHSGKVRYIGCSNYPAWLLAKSLWVSDVNRLCRYDSIQPHYSLAHRAEFERELMPLCKDQEVGVIPYSPLAGGFLTGKYKRDSELPAGSVRANRIQERYFNERGFAILDALEEISSAHRATYAQVAIAWLLANPIITSTIIGANSTSQLEDTTAGNAIQLTQDEIEQLSTAAEWQK